MSIFHVYYVREGDPAWLPSMYAARDVADEAEAIEQARQHAARRDPGVPIIVTSVEEWRKLPSNSDYEVSSLGNIRWTKKFTRNLKPSVNTQGYAVVDLFGNGRFVTHTLHRLIAEAFLPLPTPEQTQVNHLDLNKANNSVSNLEWCTPAENVRHWLKNRIRAAQDDQQDGAK